MGVVCQDQKARCGVNFSLWVQGQLDIAAHGSTFVQHHHGNIPVTIWLVLPGPFSLPLESCQVV